MLAYEAFVGLALFAAQMVIDVESLKISRSHLAQEPLTQYLQKSKRVLPSGNHEQSRIRSGE